MEVKNNNVGRALAKLKKQLHEEGRLEVYKAKQFFEKPSAKRRRKKMEGTLRSRKKQNENTLKKSTY